MSTQRINAAEKDLEKFIKFLTFKSVQVVVQSRLGEKFQTQCNALATGNDWFNIVINDHPDVAAETKHALAMKPGDTILQRLPLSVEISLKTVDGDQMVLEVWCIDLQPPTPAHAYRDTVDAVKGVANEQLIRASHAIYNRMGILLKSLITLTRTTPAYKLSRRQCPDSYDIYYRIYVDRPQTHNLGEGFKQVRIGQLNTIVGTLSMSVAYRTKMTFTPTAAQQRNGETNGIMVKSDHFRPNSDSSPAQKQSILGVGVKQQAEIEQKIIDIEEPLRPGAFTDVDKLRQFTEEDFLLPEIAPFEWLIECGQTENKNTKTNNINISNNKKKNTNTNNNNNDNENDNNHNAINEHYNYIFNNQSMYELLNQNLQYYTNQQNKNNNNNNNNVDDENDKEICLLTNVAGHLPSKNTTSTLLSNSPEFVMPIESLLIPTPESPPPETDALPSLYDEENLLKELHFPFASTTSHVNDLAKFYRDCYHAPPLRGLDDIEMYTSGSSISSSSSSSCGVNINNSNSVISCGATAFATAADSAAVDDLSRQLEQFETSLEDYDKLVSQFGLSGSSSTGSRSSGGLQMSN